MPSVVLVVCVALGGACVDGSLLTIYASHWMKSSDPLLGDLPSAPDTGVIENNVSTDGQIAINRQIDVRELRVNAHTIVCGRSAITNRVRASVWAFAHALANVDLAVETLFSMAASHLSHARQDHRGAPVRGIGIGGESGSSGHTTPGSEGSLRGRFNWAPSGGLNGGFTVGF